MNRTRLIRDAALATGKTCIACGQDAVDRVCDYPVCERSRLKRRLGSLRATGRVVASCGPVSRAATFVAIFTR